MDNFKPQKVGITIEFLFSRIRITENPTSAKALLSVVTL